MVDYDTLELMLLDNLQKSVRITINGSQYRKGIFKLFKYHGEYIEFILDDNGRTRIVSFPIPFAIMDEGKNIILSFKLENYTALDRSIIDKILACFEKRSSKFFNNDVKLEWQN